jgi:squalene-hopene/tetraprenyl-beta-curcumene cyclase
MSRREPGDFRMFSFSIIPAILLISPHFVQEGAPPPRPIQDREQILEDPANVLDERINPEKITEQDLPRLPESVILPMPPDHRVAPRPGDVPIDPEYWAKAHAAIGAGLGFLRASQDPARGAWMTGAEAAPTDQPAQVSPVSVAVTALAIKCFAQFGIDIETDRDLARAVAFVLEAQHDDGRFEGGALSNYVTSAAVSALASIDDRSLEDQLVRATRWLQESQWDQSEGLSPRQDWFGGAGYGNSGRPDMSNTQMFADALYDAGLSPDEPAFQRALMFLSRAQNLKSANPAEWAGNDGGFVYTPANGGESMASEHAGEGRFGELSAGPAGEARSLRSYGSMTYAGFKSMLYAGLSPEDERVRAAFDWIRRHWTFDENPGVGQQGLYYYYHTMARALRAAQQDVITDENDVAHNWREELIDAIVARQRPDGAWVNDADRWMEGAPELVTIYCVLALEEALK